MRKWVVLLGVALSLGACSKKSESESTKTKGKLQMGLKLVGTTGTGSLNLSSAAATDFRNISVAAGAPDEMTLTIKKMILKTEGGSKKTIFSNKTGKDIVAKSGQIDISELFSSYACLDVNGDAVEGLVCPCGLDSENKVIEKDEEGKCPLGEGTPPEGVLQVEEGTFTSLEVEYGVAAKMKGCVTGNYSSATETLAVTGIKTYCTVTDKHTFQTAGGGARSDFEIATTAATEMLVQINKTNSIDTDSTKSFSQSYPIDGGIEIKKDTTARLTLVIDNNRMLRFFNDNKADHQTPNPGMLSEKSYFFNTVFEESTFVFVGEPGSIRGYQWWTEGCTTTPMPADRICTGGSPSIVAGWMTIVKNAAGEPIVLGLMPDDDNSLTIIKGSNKSTEGLADINTPSTTNTSLYDIAFTLGTDGGGTLYDIDLSDSVAVGTEKVGTFKSKIQSNEFYGKFYMKRGL